MQRTEFSNYLDENTTLTPRAKSDTLARAQRIENIYGNLDALLHSEGLPHLLTRVQPGEASTAGISAKVLSDCRTALKKYKAFLQH